MSLLSKIAPTPTLIPPFSLTYTVNPLYLAFPYI